MDYHKQAMQKHLKKTQKVFDTVCEISRIRSTPRGQSSLRKREDKLCGRFKRI